MQMMKCGVICALGLAAVSGADGRGSGVEAVAKPREEAASPLPERPTAVLWMSYPEEVSEILTSLKVVSEAPGALYSIGWFGREKGGFFGLQSADTDQQARKIKFVQWGAGVELMPAGKASEVVCGPNPGGYYMCQQHKNTAWTVGDYENLRVSFHVDDKKATTITSFLNDKVFGSIKNPVIMTITGWTAYLDTVFVRDRSHVARIQVRDLGVVVKSSDERKALTTAGGHCQMHSEEPICEQYQDKDQTWIAAVGNVNRYLGDFAYYEDIPSSIA